MKKIAFMMMAVIIAAVTFFAAPSANAATPAAPKSKSSLMALVPDALVVEQTATLGDGRSVTIYYKKSGDLCEVYSNDDLKGYSVNDLAGLKSTSFRVVSQVKGKRIYHTTVAKAGQIIKHLVNTYL